MRQLHHQPVADGREKNLKRRRAAADLDFIRLDRLANLWEGRDGSHPLEDNDSFRLIWIGS